MLFSGTFPPRVFVMKLVRTKVFEIFAITFIVANCVTLAMADPTTEETSYVLKVLEYIFAAGFSLEMVLKVFAMGFCVHEDAYLRSGWNCLDFLIVCLSYPALIPGFGNYTAIRTLRVPTATAAIYECLPRPESDCELSLRQRQRSCTRPYPRALPFHRLWYHCRGALEWSSCKPLLRS